MLYANTGPWVEPAAAVELVRDAEAAGIESVWTVEHVVVPAGYTSQYPYNASGRMAGGEDAPIPDPLVWLTWAGAHTTTLRLATGILILPQRNPVVTAKTVATLDALTGGRVILGVGIGWLREEFDAIGVPFAGRGRRTEEWIAAMRVLWGEDHPTFRGEEISFSDARSWPKPVRRSVPIVVGGHTEASARRAGRIGDGYFPGRATVDELTTLIGVMRAAATEAGRDPASIEVTAGGRPDAETVERYRELGIDRLAIVPPGRERAQWREGMAAAVDAASA